MNDEVIIQLLNRGAICNAEFDSLFNVTFLKKQFMEETEKPIEVLFDTSNDRVISVVGRIPCFINGIDSQTALLRVLWFINRTNEQIIETGGLGSWSLNSESGHFLYTASCLTGLSSESLTSFCEATIQTYMATRCLLAKSKENLIST